MRHQLQMQYIDTVAKVGSIRKAADILCITSSALNRRILALEEDLGVPVFDRVTNGVRLNAAGEILIHHFRTQIAEMERVKSQIHDLQGERRGHVSIACSQSLMVSVLPDEIARYQEEHPHVTFSVRVCTRESAAMELRSFNAELALVFDPEQTNDFQSLACCQQHLLAQFHKRHELNQSGEVRFIDCLVQSLALPTRRNSIRLMLEKAAIKHSTSLNTMFESDNFYLLRSMIRQRNLVSFTIPVGMKSSIDSKESDARRAPCTGEGCGAQMGVNIESDISPDISSNIGIDRNASSGIDDDQICYRAIDPRDIAPALLHVGALKGRHLSVAAAKFADRISQVVADQ